MITNDKLFQGIDKLDQRCMRCGRRISELKPFDDDKYSHLKVFPNYRQMYYVDRDEECEKILRDILEFGESEEFYEIYGEENVRRAFAYHERRSWVKETLECKDCYAILDDFFHNSLDEKS